MISREQIEEFTRELERNCTNKKKWYAILDKYKELIEKEECENVQG